MKVYSKSRRQKEFLEWFIRRYEPKCYFCKSKVERQAFWNGNAEGNDGLTIHHIDFNRRNNKIDNLVLAHRRCHKAYHIKKNKTWNLRE